ncbi:hypothetical protein KR215_000052 [Drosophila sulfurigaster]|nr:hypothetical protein KR215_000052 [Drosophila sulfurigaster]
MSDNSASSRADTIQLINTAEHHFAAGDGDQIQARSTEQATGEPTQRSAVELSGGDQVEPKAKHSQSSIYSTHELEQRWKLRLQKLAEFENIQSERNESSAANGDETTAEPKTWKQFWHDATQNSTDSDP